MNNTFKLIKLAKYLDSSLGSKIKGLAYKTVFKPHKVFYGNPIIKEKVALVNATLMAETPISLYTIEHLVQESYNWYDEIIKPQVPSSTFLVKRKEENKKMVFTIVVPKFQVTKSQVPSNQLTFNFEPVNN
jgi:hypothetical protein